MSIKILRPIDVCEKLGISKATIYRLEKNNDFPKRKQLGLRAVGWLESDIDEWIQKRAKERDKS